MTRDPEADFKPRYSFVSVNKLLLPDDFFFSNNEKKFFQVTFFLKVVSMSFGRLAPF